MRLIKPSIEIIEQGPGLEGIYKQIEQAGRNCYQSSHLIKEGSAKPFVDRMIESGHYAMLEHGTVYLICRADEEGPGLDKYLYDKYSEFVYKDFNDVENLLKKNDLIKIKNTDVWKVFKFYSLICKCYVYRIILED